MSSKLFGTDGIRGIANQYPMTPDIALQVGRAIGFKVRQTRLATGHSPDKLSKVLIGKDTRLSGYMIEMALASGLCSMGANVLLTGPLPTPGIAFLTQNMRADAGIVVSASHNPFQDNGIKIFAADGFKFPPSVEQDFEKLVFEGHLLENVPLADAIGKARRIDDAIGRYVVYVKDTFPKELTLEGLKIVLDCGNGAAYKVAPWVFEELGAEVVALGTKPNGRNINDGCGALYPETMCNAVRKHKADIGISLDGDADRCVLSDESGKIVNGDHILAICAIDMHERGELPENTVVATQMSNFGLETCLRKRGIHLVKTDVGDKYVVDAMRQGHHPLGGEQSGHIIFLRHTTTGDGLIAALRVLAVMQAKKQKLSKLAAVMPEVPQILKNIKVGKRKSLSEVKGYTDLSRAIEARLDKKGRLFVRFSGTEPVVRILVEGPDEKILQQAVDEMAKLLQQELA